MAMRAPAQQLLAACKQLVGKKKRPGGSRPLGVDMGRDSLKLLWRPDRGRRISFVAVRLLLPARARQHALRVANQTNHEQRRAEN
jgi:hypothetical protein